MQTILNFFKTDSGILSSICLIIILSVGFICVLITNINLNKRYKNFMKKIGNGKNIEEDLSRFMKKIDDVEKQNQEIIRYCQHLDDKTSKCIQKVGIVRYSAYKDMGKDLSFAVAILDEENNGIVFNGIYSREMSSIYAKPVEKGLSKYSLSEEEVEAIQKAKK